MRRRFITDSLYYLYRASTLEEFERESLERLNDEQIASALSISRATLKTHIYNIYRKTNVKNRLQLAILAKH